MGGQEFPFAISLQHLDIQTFDFILTARPMSRKEYGESFGVPNCELERLIVRTLILDAEQIYSDPTCVVGLGEEFVAWEGGDH